MLPMNGSAGVLVGAVVGTLVGKDVGLGVEVGAVVGVLVGRGEAVFVGVEVGTGVSVGFGVSVAVGVDVGVSVGLSVGEGVCVLVAVAVAVKVGLDVRVAAAIGSASRFGPSCVSRTAATTQTMITAARMTSRVLMNSSHCVRARLIDFLHGGHYSELLKVWQEQRAPLRQCSTWQRPAKTAQGPTTGAQEKAVEPPPICTHYGLDRRVDVRGAFC